MLRRFGYDSAVLMFDCVRYNGEFFEPKALPSISFSYILPQVVVMPRLGYFISHTAFFISPFRVFWLRPLCFFKRLLRCDATESLRLTRGDSRLSGKFIKIKITVSVFAVLWLLVHIISTNFTIS